MTTFDKIIAKEEKCKVDGCNKYRKRQGYCKKHHTQFFKAPPKIEAPPEKIDVKKVKSDPAIKVKAKQISNTELLELYLRPCQTKEELKHFVKYFFNLHLPDVRVSRFADTSPFEFLWYLYDILVNNNRPEGVNEIIACAGRGSGKTLVVSIAQLLAVIHGKRDVVHVGAIEAQAKRAYDYIQKYLLSPRVKDLINPPKTPEDKRILQKNIMEKTVLNIKGEICTIEVLPCTIKAVNGPHVPFVTVDEIDTISGEAVKAYKDIAGMLDSKNGMKPLRVNISTRKTRHGLMEKQMSEAVKTGKTVIRWTALEFMEQCPESDSGNERTTYFVNIDQNDVLTPAKFSALASSKRNEYEMVEAFNKCGKCPLLPWCRGDARNQISNSPMLKSKQEILAKVMGEGPDWTSAQLFNLKPSAEGVVFKEFEEKRHIKTWNDMWQILTGMPYPGECSHSIFVRKCRSMKLRCYAGMDFGWTNPNTLIVLFIDNMDNVYVVMCDGLTQVSAPQWMYNVKAKHHNNYTPDLYFIDTVDPGNIMEMRKLGLPVSDEKAKQEINTGVQVIKKWLRTPGNGEPKIFINNETCKPLIEELKTYHYKTNTAGEVTEDFDKGDDHWIDPLRYIMTKIFARNAAILISDSLDRDGTLFDENGNIIRPPTVGEMVSIVTGKDLQEKEEGSKMGKLGRFDEIENPQDLDSAGTSGFIFSF